MPTELRDYADGVLKSQLHIVVNQSTEMKGLKGPTDTSWTFWQC